LTTSRVPSTLVTEVNCLVARAAAAAIVTDAVVASEPIGCSIATELKMTWPALLVTRTKSPPTTGRPRYVRSYGTYWVAPEAMTLPWVKASSALACRYAGRVATSAAVFCAASVAAGSATAVTTDASAVAGAAPTIVAAPTVSAAPMISSRFATFMNSSPFAR